MEATWHLIAGLSEWVMRVRSVVSPRRRRAIGLLPACGALFAWAEVLPSQAASGPTEAEQVLIIDLGDPLRPGFSRLTAPMQQRVRGAVDRPVQFLVEHVDPTQMEDSVFVRRAVSWWDRRHGLSRVDAVLVIGLSNTRLIDWLRIDFPDSVPIVFYARGPSASAVAKAADPIPNVFGITNGDLIAETIPSIWRLLPRTRQVIAIVSRAEEAERIGRLVQRLSPGDVSYEAMIRPTPQDMIDRGASLPPDAVFLFGNMEVDRRGRLWAPADFLDEWATQVEQPIFVQDRGHMRPGVMGGVLSDPVVNGEVIGQRLAAVLSGAISDTAPTVVIGEHPAVWRLPSLQEFEVELDSLPPGSEILEAEVPVWRRYPRGSAVMTALIITLLSFIGLLMRSNRLSRRRNRALLTAKMQIARAMASMAEWRDPETGAHIRRTQSYVRVLAEGIRELPHRRATLTPLVIDLIYESAPLHDIGKVAIRDSILLKPGKLTPEEFEEMKRHTTIGRQMLDRVQLDEEEETPFLDFAKEITQSHHEKWDGSGYPEQLAGEAIPLAARLMALADVYDALRSERPYKPALPHEEVERIIVSERGRHFDPEIVDAFLRHRDRFITIADRYRDEPTVTA